MNNVRVFLDFHPRAFELFRYVTNKRNEKNGRQVASQDHSAGLYSYICTGKAKGDSLRLTLPGGRMHEKKIKNEN